MTTAVAPTRTDRHTTAPADLSAAAGPPAAPSSGRSSP